MKAILEFDAPKMCADCCLFAEYREDEHEGEGKHFFCFANDKEIGGWQDITKIADHCPLRVEE